MNLNSKLLVQLAVYFTSSSIYAQQDVSFAADVNGDGKDELVLINTAYNSGAIRALDIATGVDLAEWVMHSAANFNTWMDAADKMFMGNVDNDVSSTQELVLVNTSGIGGAIRVVNVLTGANVGTVINHGSFGGWMDPTDKMFLGDVNGDNRADLILINTNYISGSAIRVIDLSTGDNISWIQHGSFGGWMDQTDRMLVGDVNEDNKVDLVLVNTSYAYGAIRAVDLSDGTSIKWLGHGTGIYADMMDPEDKIFLTDINGDNKKDLLFVNTNYNISSDAFRGIDIFNNGAELCMTTGHVPAKIKHGSYNGFMDNCDRVYAMDLNGDSKSELILINTSVNGEAIRVINPQNGFTNFLYNKYLDGWLDNTDRILFAKKTNGERDLLLVNTSYSAGAFRTINYLGGSPVWLGNSDVTPGLSGWLDASTDPDYPVASCSIASGLNWDKIYLGDGSIEKEQKPVNFQFYPRKSDNKGIVKLSGTLTTSNTIQFKVKKTNFQGSPLAVSSTTVNVVNNRFSVNIPINAELSEYTFSYNIGAGDIQLASNVVCGDAYIVSGQSNAETSVEDVAIVTSINNEFGPTSQIGKYSRTFGSTWFINDDSGGWGVSQIRGSINKYGVGVWGLKLQYEIQKNNSVPTCLINGAVGGTAIIKHMPIEGEYYWSNNPVQTDLLDTVRTAGFSDRYFVHLNTRVASAQLENDISGIFWLQSDGGFSGNYDTEFSPMYDLWEKFFPAFKKSYMIQIHSYVDSNEESLRKVSEWQRIMPSIYSRMSGMTANGIGHHIEKSGEEVHFQPQGYYNLADRLLGLVERDFYFKNNVDLTPPNVVKAQILNNRVSLTFDQNLSIINSDNLNNVLKAIKFYNGSNAISLNNGYNTKSNPAINANVFSFDVTDNNFTSISYAGYIPDAWVPINPDFECYLKNSKSIAAYSFHKFPLSSNSARIGEIKELSTNVSIYPSPFDNQITVENKTDKTITNISIVDLNGMMLLEQKFPENQALIDVSSLIEGAYIVQIQYDDSSVENSKIFKFK